MIMSYLLSIIFLDCNYPYIPCLDGLVVTVYASHVAGHGFAQWPSHTIDHHENGTNCFPALG